MQDTLTMFHSFAAQGFGHNNMHNLVWEELSMSLAKAGKAEEGGGVSLFFN